MDFICYNITMSNIVLSFRNYISQLNYKLLSYDKLKYEQDWGSIEHSHPYSEILFVIGGQGSFVNNGKIFSLKKGNIVITNPYISHTEVSLPPPAHLWNISSSRWRIFILFPTITRIFLWTVMFTILFPIGCKLKIFLNG